mgnify:CR=1 FL=1|jgi:hypothetical protein|tara:strand:- start:75 stop:395 length:321 start_codon:yes stop_codon:yes gene_type:complete
MLKRHQILLEDWMTDYAKHLSQTYDVSFSEIIRGSFSLAILFSAEIIHPKYKAKFKPVRLKKLLKKVGEHKLSEAEIHSLLSKMYFESRKAAEYIQIYNSKRKKKK